MEVIKIKGKSYVRMGNRLVEIDRIDDNGNPVIKADAEEIPREDGGQDVIVHVHCLKIGTSQDGRQ